MGLRRDFRSHLPRPLGASLGSKRPANANSGKERETTAPHENGKQLEPNGAACNSTRR